MPGKIVLLKKLRGVCLALPEAVESIKWGKPHFCVREKIFAGCDDDGDRLVVAFKLEMAKAKAIIRMPGFSRAPYVGHKGWVSVDLALFDDWHALEELIGESFRLIAPMECVEQLPSGTASKRVSGKKSTSVCAAKKAKSAAIRTRKK